MAKSDKFPVFIKELEELDKKKIRLLRKLLQPTAESFNRKLKMWLERKDYPLRSGELPADPGGREEWDGRTATQRLHGETTLAMAQLSRLRKKYGDDSLQLIFENAAPQAQYFFPEVSPHYISANSKPHLVYWAGEPMAWHPPIEAGGYPAAEPEDVSGGIRKRTRVNHPGHMDYGNLFFTRFKKSPEYRKIRDTYGDVLAGLIKGMRDAL